jgi:hypothetical protein
MYNKATQVSMTLVEFSPLVPPDDATIIAAALSPGKISFGIARDLLND